MRALIAVLALSLVALTGVAANGAEAHGWCGGAYSEQEGSNFSQCVEGVSAMVSVEAHAGPLTEHLPGLDIQVGGE